MLTQDQTSSAQNTPAADTNTSNTQETTSTQSTASKQVVQNDSTDSNHSTQTQEITQKEVVFDLKLPEGTSLTKEYVAKVASFAKENGLTPTQAQKILERDHTQYVENQKQQTLELDKQINGWVNQVKEDKILGGEKFAENMETAKRGFEKFSTPELRNLLRESGYGSHPEVVRMFHAIGKAMADDSFPKGGANKSEALTAGAILYGS